MFASTLAVSRWHSDFNCLLSQYANRAPANMPRAVTSWETIRRLLPSLLPRPGFLEVRALQSVPGVDVVTLGYHREQQQGHTELEGGDLVRLSLHAIDQELSVVQRGERIWFPCCGVGIAVETRVLQTRLSLMTQAVNSTPQRDTARLALVWSYHAVVRSDNEGLRSQCDTRETATFCNCNGAFVDWMHCCS
jgi:hypothetical protein